jgi:hypothetical protein
VRGRPSLGPLAMTYVIKFRCSRDMACALRTATLKEGISQADMARTIFKKGLDAYLKENHG